MMIQLPEEVCLALSLLTEAGYQAWLVGGVRDSLLGIPPHDWDITTSAKPEETKAVFRDYKMNASGEKYGTVCVFVSAVPIDITTFRKEGAYTDHRHPENVVFTANLFEDLKRRDFTVNAIAYHPVKGFCDYFCGRRDLRKRMIRAIGKADERFSEDALRILRALRFSAVLGFDIEEHTKDAIHRCKALLNHLPKERILPEFVRMMCGKNIRRVLTEFADVLAVLIPEILPCVGFSQHSPFHQYDVWQHTVHAVAASEPEPDIRLALLFHDMSKPGCFSQDSTGRGHFYSHPKKSTVLAREIMMRMKFPQKQIETVCTLVSYHDSHPSTAADVKMLLCKIGENRFRQLLTVMEADILAHNKWTVKKRLAHLLVLRDNANRIVSSGECYSLKTLAVTGFDLQEIGYHGEEIGKLLDEILLKVVSGKLQNDKEKILCELKEKNP